MADIFLKPGQPGLIVRDPVTGTPLKADGEYKPRDTYWIRRIKDKDVIEATPGNVSTEEKG